MGFGPPQGPAPALSVGVAIPAGLGAITQITGPSDQDLRIASTNPTNIRMSPGTDTKLYLSGTLQQKSFGSHLWSSTGNVDGTPDTGLARSAAAILKATDGASGIGDWQANKSALTAGTMTASSSALVREVVHKYSWTNAMVVAAAGTSDKVDVCTLPAKTIVKQCYVVIGTAADQAATLTVQVGPSDDTDGYIVASDAKAAANTVYGDALAELGDDLFSTNHLFPLKSYTGTTLIQAQFVIGAGTLADVTSSTGHIFLTTQTLP